MPPIMIIGLYSSTPQSGKSTVGNVLRLDNNFHHISFAHPVKETIVRMLDLLDVKAPRDYIYGVKKDEIIPELNKTGGFLLASFATDWAREKVTSDIWLNEAVRKFNQTRKHCPDQKIYIDDMRFLNEYNWLRSVGAILIRVLRDGTENTRTESSEGNLDDLFFDFTIENNGSYEELILKTQFIVNKL